MSDQQIAAAKVKTAAYSYRAGANCPVYNLLE